MLKKLYLILALLVTPQLAMAQAFWIDYGWNVKPKDEARFMAAVERFTASDVFASFPGKMWFNAHVANGPDSTTHSFAVVYDDVSQFESFSAQLQGTKEWDRFRKALNATGTPTNETIYNHVIGFGDHPKDKTAFIGTAMQVSNPAGYVGALKDLVQIDTMSTLPGSLDIWAVMAGGAPGVTHTVVFGYDRFSEGQAFLREAVKDPVYVKKLTALGNYRTLLPSLWVNTPKKYGTAELSNMR